MLLSSTFVSTVAHACPATRGAQTAAAASTAVNRARTIVAARLL